MLPLQHPFTAIVAGPTGCGNSEWILRLTGHAKEMIEPPPEDIWYCYGEFQPIFARYPEVKFHESMPDFTKFDGRRSTFLVLDDLMSEKNDDVANLFTKGSHHRNVSVMFMTQNLFYKKQTHAYHQSECTLHDTVQESTRCRSVFHFGSTDVFRRIQICRRSVSRDRLAICLWN